MAARRIYPPYIPIPHHLVKEDSATSKQIEKILQGTYVRERQQDGVLSFAIIIKGE